MSLKVEQILSGVYLDIEREQRIYTTGAHLVPLKVNEHYVWIAWEFEDDTYDSDGKLCTPVVLADQVSKLLISDNDE